MTMKRQIPVGPDHLKCPLWKQTMDKVCHKCPLWVQLRGKNPQSTEEIDEWNCALAFLPILLVENSQRQMQTAASIQEQTAIVQRAGQHGYETTAMLTGLLNRALDIPRSGDVKLLE